MPIYDYVGTTEKGRIKKGRITAKTRQDALLQIVQKGLTIRSFGQRSDSIWLKDITSFSRRVKLKEKVLFLRQFATIIRAGVTVAEALNILSDQEENNKFFKSVIEEMAEELTNGRTLSEAFEKQPKIFSPMIVHMVRAGEESGRLEESLNHLAAYYERQHRSRQKLSTAMVYPAFILMMSMGVVFFLLTSIVPMFESMFAGLNIDMPFLTRLILAVSNMTKAYWLVIVLVMIAIICFFFLLLKNKSSKLWVDHAIIRAPVIGQIVYKNELSRLLWMLALLLSSSVPVIDALRSIEKISPNLALQQAIREVVASLDLGQSLSEAFRREKIFPAIVFHMTAIGEKTGMLDNMLQHVAKFYEDDVEQLLERMKALIEPVVIILLSLLVGVIVLAVVIPMFQIFKNF